MSIFQTSRLVPQVHMVAGQNEKKKYLMCQIPIKMFKQPATPNSNLHNRCRKTSQRWHICMYLANTAVLNIWTFSRRYHFRLYVFASTGEYFYYWHWQVLPSILFRPKLIFFSFSIFAELFICFLMCSDLHVVAMSSINTGILIFILSYLYFISSPMLLTVNVSIKHMMGPNIVPCFTTSLTCILSVSYWCSNYYICFFVHFI